MILIDKIVGSSSETLAAIVDVKPGMEFFDASLDGIPSWIGIEYMAQSIAAYSGLKLHRSNQSIGLGMLISCRRYSVKQPVFGRGSRLLVDVRELAGTETGMAAYKCSIREQSAPDEMLATGQLGVYLSDTKYLSDE